MWYLTRRRRNPLLPPIMACFIKYTQNWLVLSYGKTCYASASFAFGESATNFSVPRHVQPLFESAWKYNSGTRVLIFFEQLDWPQIHTRCVTVTAILFIIGMWTIPKCSIVALFKSLFSLFFLCGQYRLYGYYEFTWFHWDFIFAYFADGTNCEMPEM